MIGVVICAAIIMVTVMFFWGFGHNKDSPPEGVRGGRPLGDQESFMATMGRKGFMQVVRSAVFTSSKPILLQYVQTAMHRVAQRHPLLRFRVKDFVCQGKRQQWFIPMKDIVVNIEERTETDWMTVFEEQLSTASLDVDKGPLWCVKFLPEAGTEFTDDTHPYQCALVFVFNHAICDATSMFHIINEVMDTLNGGITGQYNSETQETLPIPESLDTLTGIAKRRPLPFKILAPVVTRFPGLVTMLLKRMMGGDKNIWEEKLGFEVTRNPGIEARTCILPMSFSKSQTEALMKACRSHQVSPLAALQAAFILTVADKLSIPDTEVQFGTSVNFRPYLARSSTDEIHQQVAPYISRLSCKLVTPQNLAEPDFWGFALACKKVVHNDLWKRSEEMLHLISLLAVVNMEDIVPKHHSRMNSLADFNNCGNCSYLDRSDDSPLHVRSIYGCSEQTRNGPLFSVHCVSFNKQFFWNLTYFPHIVSKEVTSEIAKKIQELMILQSCER